jgi:hypothetical protein
LAYPYQFAGNSPIDNLDLDGLEQYDYKLVIVQENGKSKLQVEHTGTVDDALTNLGGEHWYIDVGALGVKEQSKFLWWTET